MVGKILSEGFLGRICGSEQGFGNDISHISYSLCYGCP